MAELRRERLQGREAPSIQVGGEGLKPPAPASLQEPRVHVRPEAVALAGQNAGAESPQKSPSAGSASAPGVVTQSPSNESAPDPADEAVQRQREFLQAQHRRKELLQACERLLLLDYVTLSLPNWPDNFQLAEARRRRDAWITGMSALAVAFLLGAVGMIPAWLAGVSLGCLFLLVLLGVPWVRSVIMQRPSWLDLIVERRRQIRMAAEHVRQLEGTEGLAWRCAQLRDFNSVLDQPVFSALIKLSRARMLAQTLRKRGHLRLYLIYILEAEKAYKRLEKAYLAAHQEALEQGWLGQVS